MRKCFHLPKIISKSSKRTKQYQKCLQIGYKISLTFQFEAFTDEKSFSQIILDGFSVFSLSNVIFSWFLNRLPNFTRTKTDCRVKMF